jgi:hypothetical protein
MTKICKMENKMEFSSMGYSTLSHYCSEQPKGLRLGYMGHLTYISDEACKLLEKCGPDFADDIRGDTTKKTHLSDPCSFLMNVFLSSLEAIDMSAWESYVMHQLQETKDRDSQPLGGARPNPVHQNMYMAGSIAGDEADSGGDSIRKVSGISSANAASSLSAGIRLSGSFDSTEAVDTIKNMLAGGEGGSAAHPDFSDDAPIQNHFDNGSDWAENAYD